MAAFSGPERHSRQKPRLSRRNWRRCGPSNSRSASPTVNSTGSLPHGLHLSPQRGRMIRRQRPLKRLKASRPNDNTRRCPRRRALFARPRGPELLVRGTDRYIQRLDYFSQRHRASSFCGRNGNHLADGGQRARSALNMPGLEPDDIDAIVVATSTPDLTFPSARNNGSE